MKDKEKIATIIQLLAAKTEKGEIRWDATEKAEVLQTSLANGTVRLFPRSIRREHPTQPGIEVPQRDLVVAIFNENAELIDEASDVELKDVMERPYYVLREMYSAARRQAKGVDKALDQILTELQK